MKILAPVEGEPRDPATDKLFWFAVAGVACGVLAVIVAGS